MCVVIDTNVIHAVFGVTTADHKKYQDIFKWLFVGKGKMVYGGKKYKSELRACSGKYIERLAELNRLGKIIRLDDYAVDTIQADLERMESNPDFDDPHLVAIVIESGCKIVCTNERRAIRFLRSTNLYPRPSLRPSIYRSERNSNMITDSRYMAEICNKTK